MDSGSRVPKIDELWGGSVVRLSVELATQLVDIRVHVIDSGVETHHDLRLTGMREFRFTNSIPGPWNYVELTELHASFDAQADAWRIEALLWSEEATLTVVCAEVRLDGVRLTDAAAH